MCININNYYTLSDFFKTSSDTNNISTQNVFKKIQEKGTKSRLSEQSTRVIP